MLTHENYFLMRDVDLQLWVSLAQLLGQCHYLLVALHQFQRLALDIVLATNDISKDWGKITSLEFRRWDLDIEMTSVLVLELQLYVVFFCIG